MPPGEATLARPPGCSPNPGLQKALLVSARDIKIKAGRGQGNAGRERGRTPTPQSRARAPHREANQRREKKKRNRGRGDWRGGRGREGITAQPPPRLLLPPTG